MVPGNMFLHEKQRVTLNYVPASEGEEPTTSSTDGGSTHIQISMRPGRIHVAKKSYHAKEIAVA